MYYMEKVINGILMFKSFPDGPWKMVHPEKITKRMLKAEARERQLMADIEMAVEFLHEGTIDSADQALQILDKKHLKESQGK